MILNINLSDEEKTRLEVWISALNKVCGYCVVCEEKSKKLLKLDIDIDKDSGEYEIAGTKYFYFPSLVIMDGLLEAAIIGLSSIFNCGRTGKGVADNYNNNIKLIRKIMLERTAEKLGHSNANYMDEYKQKIIDLRNQLVAHYDGSISEYRKDFVCKCDVDRDLNEQVFSVSKFRLPKALFSQNEIAELKEIVIKMYESLIEILHEVN